MANFSGKNICDTYTSILNIGNGECILPQEGLVVIADSKGNTSSLCIGRPTCGICVSGPINSTGAIEGGGLCGTSLNISGAAETGSLNANGAIIANSFTSNSFVQSASGSFTSTLTANTIIANEIKSFGDITAFYTSDRRLKENLNTIHNTQSIINGLTGYSFQWGAESGKEGGDIGIMAQDVQAVLPLIVKQRDDGYLAVDYIKLIPVLIEEVKRLNREIKSLL
jgi:hypothetical protein